MDIPRFWQLPSLIDHDIFGVFNQSYLIVQNQQEGQRYIFDPDKYYRGDAEAFAFLDNKFYKYSAFDSLLFKDQTIYRWQNNNYLPISNAVLWMFDFWPNQLITDYRDQTLTIYQIRDNQLIELFKYIYQDGSIIKRVYNAGIDTDGRIIVVYSIDDQNVIVHNFVNATENYSRKIDKRSIAAPIFSTNHYTVDGHYLLDIYEDNVWNLHDMTFTTKNNSQCFSFNRQNELLYEQNNSSGTTMKFYRGDQMLELPLSLTGNLQSQDLLSNQIKNRYANAAIKFTYNFNLIERSSYNGVIQPNDILYIDFSKMQAFVLKDFKYAVDAEIYVLCDNKFLILNFLRSSRIEIWVLDTFQWSAATLYQDQLGRKIGDTLLAMQKENLWLPPELMEQVVKNIIEQEG